MMTEKTREGRIGGGFSELVLGGALWLAAAGSGAWTKWAKKGGDAVAKMGEARECFRAGRSLLQLDIEGACQTWRSVRFDPEWSVPTSMIKDEETQGYVLPPVEMGENPYPVNGSLPFRQALEATLAARAEHLEPEEVALAMETLREVGSWSERGAIIGALRESGAMKAIPVRRAARL